MTRIVIDPLLHTKLTQLREPAELCDQEGRVVGRYTPTPVDPSTAVPQVSDEELDRRKNSAGKRYTTEEVLRHLESL